MKRRKHQKALIEAATSGSSKFFLGTDSAPHEINKKENSCGCAGVFNTINSIETITQIFELENALDNLEKFLSFNGSKHYGLPVCKEKITLIKGSKPIAFPESLNKNEISIKVLNLAFLFFGNC